MCVVCCLPTHRSSLEFQLSKFCKVKLHQYEWLHKQNARQSTLFLKSMYARDNKKALPSVSICISLCERIGSLQNAIPFLSTQRIRQETRNQEFQQRVLVTRLAPLYQQ